MRIGRRVPIALVIVAALVGAALAYARPGGHTANATLRPALSGFQSPVYLTAPRSEPSRLYVVEQPGRIIAVQGSRRWVFLDIRKRVSYGGERGLLSVAFHPNYAKNHRFYVDYTDVDGDTRIVEFRSNGHAARLATQRQLLFVKQPYANHNGGQLQFGRDGLLYVGMGDGGSADDPGNRGQSLHTRLAKLLRIDVNKRRPSSQIAAYGLRNPWRFSFDRATGDLWIADVGQDAWEEIDYRTRAQVRQRWNFGWSIFEGRTRFKDVPPNPASPLVSPVYVYPHANGDCSVTGGYVYRGSAVPAAQGRYFFGDYCTGRVWSARLSGADLTDLRREGTVAQLTSFGESAGGDLYAVSGGGAMYKHAP
jgi:glucose/arabinose dehydrogenase